MSKKILWLVVSGLMALSLVVTACGSAAVEVEKEAEKKVVVTEKEKVAEKEMVEKEVVKSAAEVPKYGGTLSLSLSGDVTNFDFLNPSFQPGRTFQITNDPLWEGDWTKGPAGGYGTKEASWTMSNDILDLKAGNTVASWKWSADFEKNEGTIVYQVRQGVHFALNPASEASRLANGREVTADDMVYTLDLLTHDSRTYIYSANPELRSAQITKTGPWEVSVKTTVDALMTALGRFGYWGRVIPREVVAKYRNMQDWKNSVGTGPFMLIDNIPGSTVVLKKNPNYWAKDPIGPGKGNQLPYIDGFRYLIIPDASTRLAALRTAKYDQMRNNSWEDAAQLRKTTPQLKELEEAVFGAGAIQMRTDQPPFNDVRVRRALMMATDLEAIRQSLNGGLGATQTWPWPYTKEYADVYLDLNDPKMPESVREIYTYNPEKAKALLKEAGYPQGFKTTILTTSGGVDYYAIMKDMWAKVGIELEFMIRESGVASALMSSKQHPALASSGVSQAVMYYLGGHFTGTGASNLGMINDPILNEAMERIRRTMITDERAAMRIWPDELMAYFLGQVFAIPRPQAPVYNFWWPWIKNYSGEVQVGYGTGSFDTWTRWVWIDQELKRSMGYK